MDRAVMMFSAAAAASIAAGGLAGCASANGEQPSAPAAAPSSASPSSALPSPTETNAAWLTALPLKTRYKLGGWSYEINVSGLPSVQAATEIKNSPPGYARLTVSTDGPRQGSITSLDTGRNAPTPPGFGIKYLYPAGSPIPSGLAAGKCTSTTAFDYCNIGFLEVDGISGLAEQMSTSGSMAEADAARAAAYLNATPPTTIQLEQGNWDCTLNVTVATGTVTASSGSKCEIF